MLDPTKSLIANVIRQGVGGRIEHLVSRIGRVGGSYQVGDDAISSSAAGTVRGRENQ
jgi:hypothetical protein